MTRNLCKYKFKQKAILENEIQNWMNGRDQIDDMMILGFRV